jgi:hypothetical protein
VIHAAAHVLQKEDRILFGLEPHADESFFGFTARLANYNHFNTRSAFLTRVGFEHLRKQGLETALEAPGRLAWRLRLTEDQFDRLTARHDPLGDDYRRFIDCDRRVSPAGLRKAPYHRARWALKLPYCPETWEILVQKCPICNEALGWQRTLRVELCEHCGFDLRAAKTPMVPPRRRKWLALLAALIDPDPSRRAPAGLTLPPQLAECSSTRAFEVAMVFAQVTALMKGRETPRALNAVRGGVQRAADMAAGMEILARYPESFDEKMTSGNVALPDFFKLARARAGKSCFAIVRELYCDWEPCNHGPSRLRVQREGAGQLTLREAARELRIENRVLRALIDQGLIDVPSGRGVVRKIQWLDPASVREAGRRMNDRISFSEFSQAHKISDSGVGQLVSLGLLNLNRDPILKRLHSEPQLHRSAAVELASRLLALRHVPPPDIPLWPLEDVFHGIGAQQKPWGAILKAALQREIVLYCDDQISEKLHISKLQIARSLAHEILARARPELLLVPEAIEPELNDVVITRVEAENYLNCFPRDLSWLIAEGHLRRHPHRCEVAELGRKLISSREISWRWRISPSFRDAMAKDRGIKRTIGPFWSRAAVEGYFAEVFPAGRPI